MPVGGHIYRFLCAALLLAVAGAARADTAALSLELLPAFDGSSFSDPVFLTHAGDGTGRLYVVEQEGKIYRMAGPESGKKELFLDITDGVRARGEMGLLAVAFHPRFADNGFFYVYYSARRPRPKRGHHYGTVVRFRADGDGAADPGSAREMLRVAQPYSNHNGGCLAFGPDGYLYVGLGDGGLYGDPEGHGQNLGTLLGTILRLDVDGGGEEKPYGIPKDNPFVGRRGARGEIWAYGLRNPWRFSFDRKTGELWAGDVGQNDVEEIDLIVKGGNYGWDHYEGSAPYGEPSSIPNARFSWPVAEYKQGSAGRSVTGGYVYRGSASPDLRGMYLYGDFISGRLRGLRRVGKRVYDGEILATGKAISSFGEDEAGEVYLVDYGGGIYRIASGDGSRRRPTPAP